METKPRLFSYVNLPAFDETAERWLDDEDIRHVQQILNQNPRAGDVVPGTGGLRKLRIAVPGRGKRGGGRLIYLYVEVRSRIYLMAVFSKTELTDITPAGYRALRNLAAQLRKER